MKLSQDEFQQYFSKLEQAASVGYRKMDGKRNGKPVDILI
jgi:hypothetical protein